jgi:Concanavalin A-like lectin/glucanases superfamily
MKRLGIGFGISGLLLIAACTEDAVTPTPGTAGSGGSATTAGTTSGGSAAGGSSAGSGMTAGTTSGGSSAGTAAGGSSAGSGGTTVGGASGSGGTGGAGGSGGSGGSGGGGACDPATGKALQFKGGTNDLMVGDLGADLAGGNGARTVEVWAHFTSKDSWKAEGSVIEMGRRNGQANQVFGIDMADDQTNGRTDANSGKFDPYTNGIGDNDPTPVMVPVTGWAHLAWGYDGAGHFQFVVNGTKVTLPKPGDGAGALAITAGIFTLGGSQSFGTTGWDGVMDEVRAWSVFRSEADIKRDMKIKLKGTEAGLVAYWNLDEGTGETADDIKKTATHQLKFCTANGGACPVQNAAKPMWVASDIPGPFTCAP